MISRLRAGRSAASPSALRALSALLVALATSLTAPAAFAQPTAPADDGPPSPETPPALPPSDPTIPPPPSTPEPAPLPQPEVQPPTATPIEAQVALREPSGRDLVDAYNVGFQWGISPGLAIVNGKAGFAIGGRIGYGFDLGPVILVPGVRFMAYFVDATILVPTAVAKLVIPIGAFAPFIEGGGGIASVSKPSGVGLDVIGGGGFMYHFSDRFALGAQASYETVVAKLSGTKPDFSGISFGPILAIGF